LFAMNISCMVHAPASCRGRGHRDTKRDSIRPTS
jgi:hypothetical protein